jgi:hypothetical protein
VVVAVCGAPAVFAETSNSTHYQLNDSSFTAGSAKQTCSTSYCSQTSIGATGGDTAGVTTKATFGPVTESQPELQVIVAPGTSNLGVLTTTSTATKTTSVKIQTYLSSGYMLQITGAPPKYASHTLATPSSPTTSTQGTEQFGINLVANTTPNIGANLVQVPSGTFSFGVVNSNYNTANQFMYNSGDVVAHSNSASGETDYTISFIVNISNDTPAGQYHGDYSAVVIPTY